MTDDIDQLDTSNFFYTFLTQYLPISQRNREKEIFLVVGDTGVGKSCFIIYLLKVLLVRTGTNLMNYKAVVNARTDDPKILPVIGNGDESTTLFAQPHFTSINDPQTNQKVTVGLCDSPGFESERSKVEQAIESIAIELAVSFSARVNGIFILISYPEFVLGHLRGVSPLMEKLLQLFGEHIQSVASSFIFIVSKIPPEEKDLNTVKNTIVAAANEKIKGYQKEVKNRKNANHTDSAAKARYQAFQQKLNFYRLIVEANKDGRFFAVDIFDQGESRAQIYNTMIKMISNNQQGAPEAMKEYFHFDQNNAPRLFFNTLFYKAIEIYNGKLESFFRQEQGLSLLQQKESRLKSTYVELMANKANANNLVQKITKNFLEIQVCNGQITKNQQELVRWNEKLTLLDTDALIPFWSDELDEAKNPWQETMGFNGAFKRFIYDDPDNPFDSYTHDLNSGELTVEIYQPSKGKFQAVYKTDPGIGGKIQITLLIKTKNDPGNKKLILQLQGSIKECNVQQNNLHAKIKDLSNENEVSRSQLEKIYARNRATHDAALAEASDPSTPSALPVQQSEQSENLFNLQNEALSSQTIKDQQDIKETEKQILTAMQDVQRKKQKIEHDFQGIREESVILNGLNSIATNIKFPSELPLSFTKLFDDFQKNLYGLGRNKLHAAILMKNSADVNLYAPAETLRNQPDKNGDTPLHLAIKERQTLAAIKLVIEGASLTMRNKEHQSSFHLFLDSRVDTDELSTAAEKRLLTLMLLRDKGSLFMKYFEVFCRENECSRLYDDICHLKIEYRHNHINFKDPIKTILANITAEDLNEQPLKDDSFANALKELSGFPELEPLLRILVFALLGYNHNQQRTVKRKLIITIDTKTAVIKQFSLTERDNHCQAVGAYYQRENTDYINIAGDRPLPLLRGTFLHEITHFVSKMIFGNENCEPYSPTDTNNRDNFIKICDALEADDNAHPILKAVFKEPIVRRHAELIARVPQLIAMTNDYSQVGAAHCQPLRDYYNDVFLPACYQYLQKLHYNNYIICLERTSTTLVQPVSPVIASEKTEIPQPPANLPMEKDRSMPPSSNNNRPLGGFCSGYGSANNGLWQTTTSPNSADVSPSPPPSIINSSAQNTHNQPFPT